MNQSTRGNNISKGGSTSHFEYGRRLLMTYAWIIGKNLLGWLLILFSLPAGALIPGPGGLPMFLIGFAMVSFPGKRMLTARVMRGVPIPRESTFYKWGTVVACLLAPLGALVYIYVQRDDPWLRRPLHWFGADNLGYVYLIAYVLLVVALWLLLWPGRTIINKSLQLAPKVRRKVRPWLRRQGIDLLPPRRRRRRLIAGGPFEREPDPEILAIDERHYRRAHLIWRRGKPWLRRVGGLVITIAIFYWISKPIIQSWPVVRAELLDTNPVRFAAAAIMFTLFLAFRAISWRRILIGLGHKLPVAPAVRIWSTSELARYLPGAIWQIMGRIYLVRPYGVSGSVSSTSQVLELAVFLLANVIIAAACFLYFGIKIHPDARIWLYACAALVPLLALFLHPKVFYGLVDALMVRLKKPKFVERLSGWALIRMLGRTLIALIWQNIAVFLLVQPVLGLEFDHWWTVSGAYCLAWCAGFLAFWAPGGIGVREFVFIAAMQLVLPAHITELHGTDRTALLAFLAILLRLWTVVGEVVLATVAYVLDIRGALDMPGAQGRMIRSRAESGRDPLRVGHIESV
ncbi:MAG TPA: lysylphosphatidylglycerol synthase domain-containing protein [Tepidisphaeraceae bacterium]|jgi:hypothetical protein|nr:lysylphosphatidylglycerol synthase domain-containing protein [Tepidisphaeraceae bacterium]